MSVLKRKGSRADVQLLAVSDRTGLALQFEWHGDRYGQRLSAIFDGVTSPLASSIERSTSPGSHAFQELSMQRIAESELGFLVGLANKAYWSASVEVLPSGRGFQWDISCKGPSTERLIYEYEFVSPLNKRQNQVVTRIPNEGWECVIECEKIAPSDTQLVTDGQRLRTETQVLADRGNSPVRWKIRMELCRDKANG